MSAIPSFLNDPIYIGSTLAQQRGAQGDLSIDLVIAPTGAWIEFGPFRIQRDEAEKLRRRLGFALGVSAPAMPNARVVAEVAVCGLSEGETRP